MHALSVKATVVFDAFDKLQNVCQAHGLSYELYLTPV